MTSLDPPGEPGESHPTRTYSSRTFYTGEAKSREHFTLGLGRVALNAVPAIDALLAMINSAGGAGFCICHRCGFALSGYEQVSDSHQSPWSGECQGILSRYHLVHEFKTDILQLHFQGHSDRRRGFWLSSLYAPLEGASVALDIERNDLDGCLYPYEGDPTRPGIIVYENVPGGAGHVKRIAEDPRGLQDMLSASHVRLENCECGGPEGTSSCYGCLRNYWNRFCHEDLQRGPVIEFLRSLVLS